MTWDECLPELMLQLGELGMVAVVKMDGERVRRRWTVVLSGGPIPAGESIRCDDDELNDALSSAIAVLRKHRPGVLDC